MCVKKYVMDNQDQNIVDKDREIDDLLADPTKKVAILQWLARLNSPHLLHGGSNGGGGGMLSPSGSATIPAHYTFFNPAVWYRGIPSPWWQ